MLQSRFTVFSETPRDPGGLDHIEAGEVPELDDLRLPGVPGSQLRERLVDRKHPVDVAVGGRGGFEVQVNALQRSVTLARAMRSGMVEPGYFS